MSLSVKVSIDHFCDIKPLQVQVRHPVIEKAHAAMAFGAAPFAMENFSPVSANFDLARGKALSERLHLSVFFLDFFSTFLLGAGVAHAVAFFQLCLVLFVLGGAFRVVPSSTGGSFRWLALLISLAGLARLIHGILGLCSCGASGSVGLARR